MSNNTAVKSGGIGLFGLTFVVLLALKLTDSTSISWWWVTAPLWGPWLVLLAIVLIVFLIAGAVTLFEKR